MSHTYLDIKTYDNKRIFDNRMQHNLRKSNLNKEDKSEYKNIIFDNRESYKLQQKQQQKQQKPELTKSELTQKIASYTYKLKTAKKPATIEKYNKCIEELKEQRDNTQALNKVAKKGYIEVVFSITNILPKYKKDEQYLRDLGNILNEFKAKALPNMEIIAAAGHLDQSNPHIHINGMYSGENSLTKDLNGIYGGKKHYSDMQQDFTKFVREHELMKKYKDIVIEDNVKGGRKDYLKLSLYKEAETKAKELADSKINKLLSNIKNQHKNYLILNKDKVIEDLTKHLVDIYSKNILDKDLPRKTALKNMELEVESIAYKQLLVKFNEDKKQYQKQIEELKQRNQNLELINSQLVSRNRTLEETNHILETKDLQKDNNSRTNRR